MRGEERARVTRKGLAGQEGKGCIEGDSKE